MLQVSSAEATSLHEQAAARAEATLVAHVDRSIAQAFNVTAKIAGTNPGAGAACRDGAAQRLVAGGARASKGAGWRVGWK